jgi:general secretion pathway protein L
MPKSVRLLRCQKGRLLPVALLGMDAEPGQWRDAFAARQRGEPVVLSLSSPLLVRQTTLPLAAETTLGRVLGYEMDRLTPFAAAEVFFSHKVLHRDRAKGQLTVELALAPRAWTAALIAGLATSGVHPASIEAPGPDGRLRRIALDPADPARTARIHALMRFGWIACGVLVIAILLVPLLRQWTDLAEVDEQIAELRPRVDQANALRARIAASTSGAGQVAAARHRSQDTLRTIALLTDLLPDDTWLVGLSLHQPRLTIEGQSAAATKLIGLLANEPRLRSPAFAAPVVRSDSGTDLFTIQAEFGF